MTKRTEIIKQIRQHAKKAGQTFTMREGGSHTKVQVGSHTTYIPRHREIAETLTKAIYKQIGLQ